MPVKPSRSKIIWGFGQLLPLLRSYILTSRFISSDDKDSLVKTLETLYADLLDANKRASGKLPYPPSVIRKWHQRRKELERERKRKKRL